MIFSIIAFLSFAVVALVLESMGMLLSWEPLLFAIMAVPLFAYARSNKAWLNFYVSMMTLTMMARIPYVPYIAQNSEDVYYPLSATQPVVSQAIGITYYGGMMAYLLMIWIFTALQIHRDIKNNDDISRLRTKNVILNQNLLHVSAICAMLNSGVATKVYGLHNALANSIVFAVISGVLALGHFLFVKDMIRGKILDYQEQEELEEAAANDEFYQTSESEV